MSLIRNPKNPYPQNLKLDPTNEFINFTFSGERLGSYQINIFEYPHDFIRNRLQPPIYSSEIISTEYKYNDETIFSNETILQMLLKSTVNPAITGTAKDFVNKSFTWQVKMSPNKKMPIWESSFKFSGVTNAGQFLNNFIYGGEVLINKDSTLSNIKVLDFLITDVESFSLNLSLFDFYDDNIKLINLLKFDLSKLKIKFYYKTSSAFNGGFYLYDSSGQITAKDNLAFSEEWKEYNKNLAEIKQTQNEIFTFKLFKDQGVTFTNNQHIYISAIKIYLEDEEELLTENFSSLEYFFETNTKPIISPNQDTEYAGFTINDSIVEYNESSNIPHISSDIVSRKLKLEGYYSLFQNSDSIKYWYVVLYDDNNTLIDQTDYNYSARIYYEYDGLRTNNYYKIDFFAFSQTGQIVNVVIELNVKYDERLNTQFIPILEQNPEKNSIIVKWNKDYTSVPQVNGEIELLPEGGVHLKTGELIYNEISGNPITMDKKNFAVGLKTSIHNKISSMKIFDYINNNIKYQVFIKNYKFYYQIDEAQPIDCGVYTRENIEFAVQDYAIPKEDTGYMWYVSEDYNWSEDNTKYYLIDNSDTFNRFSILLQSNEGTVSCTIKRLGGANG